MQLSVGYKLWLILSEGEIWLLCRTHFQFILCSDSIISLVAGSDPGVFESGSWDSLILMGLRVLLLGQSDPSGFENVALWTTWMLLSWLRQTCSVLIFQHSGSSRGPLPTEGSHPVLFALLPNCSALKLLLTALHCPGVAAMAAVAVAQPGVLFVMFGWWARSDAALLCQHGDLGDSQTLCGQMEEQSSGSAAVQGGKLTWIVCFGWLV